MKLGLLLSRPWNWMQLLADELFNTVRHKAMRQRSSCLTLNRVLFHNKVGWHQDSITLKLMKMSMKPVCLFAKERMLSVYMRQVWCCWLDCNFIFPDHYVSDLICLSTIIRFLLLDQHSVMMTYSFWIQNLRFFSLMDPNHLFKRGLKLLKLSNT